ncbi:MAG: 4Fe-4S dicluster domain-containing protein [Desulfobacteraceae bacterium]|nr:4Fe-4S dicluster domain-containing protein [Desulfobacteraceae bacterium]
MLDGIITMIPVYVMGRKYEIPKGLTILKALEFAGYRLTRGCGCRGGVCGACVTVYRQKGDYKLKVGLSCQTVVEPEMNLVQLPYTPANKAIYSIKTVVPDDTAVIKAYPELMRCVACNTCTKACPMGLEVMNTMAAAKRGDFKTVVELSIECIMCGMCAARCPAEISPLNVALLIRRIYGKYSILPAAHLKERLENITDGKYKKEIETLKSSDLDELKRRFSEFQATKGEAV